MTRGAARVRACGAPRVAVHRSNAPGETGARGAIFAVGRRRAKTLIY
jgi:hypothetical protein